MKKRKLLSLVLALSLCCSMLTGCMGQVADVKINEDGSGTIQASFGLTAEALDMMNSMSNEDGSTEGTVSDKEAMTPFEYNGVTYYGEVESYEFKNITELNDLFKGEVSESSSDIDTGLMRFIENSDKSLTFILETNDTTGDTSSIENSIESESQGIDAETVELLMKDMAIVFSFTFPEEIKQISGSSEGITIEGNKLTIDFIKLGDYLAEVGESASQVFAFTTGDGTVVPIASFIDVLKNAWYYDSVMAMADGGLVAGVGDNKFNPDGTLTYGQFCTILARASMLETGELNGYWAGKAIESCINAGYINDLGEINSKTYDVAITREAAISAMYLASGVDKVVKEVLPENIPDFSDIADEFKTNILEAYKLGITSGMDNLGTFKPQGELTRAQICTLFHNLDWTHPIDKNLDVE